MLVTVALQVFPTQFEKTVFLIAVQLIMLQVRIEAVRQMLPQSAQFLHSQILSEYKHISSWLSVQPKISFHSSAQYSQSFIQFWLNNITVHRLIQSSSMERFDYYLQPQDWFQCMRRSFHMLQKDWKYLLHQILLPPLFLQAVFGCIAYPLQELITIQIASNCTPGWTSYQKKIKCQWRVQHLRNLKNDKKQCGYGNQQWQKCIECAQIAYQWLQL